ncbi:MAG TPA: hypothetical protein PK020_11205 [Ilumatobacteraceae bacterium]|nr:hypothetical protein [Ilumatobacteraceae bacterium]HRB01997.1 hypothetical protein [Ilumatobacteraceae bacterium]
MSRDPVDQPDASRIGVADYRWTDATRSTGADAFTAELWLRHIWEDAPKAVRVFLRCGWRFGLGLRLGPADRSHVLGWRIDGTSDAAVTVSAKSRILSAQNTITVSDDLICWQTVVHYERLIGRLLWLPASLLHQLIVPWSVRRAVRSRA